MRGEGPRRPREAQLARSTGRLRHRSELGPVLRPHRATRRRRRPKPDDAAGTRPTGGGLTQLGTAPTPLRAPARPTQSLEPILFPKLRIQFADFPYLHCSITRGCSPWRPAADMGTARHEIHTVSPGFSRADGGAPDTAGSAVLYGDHVPISGQADSRE